MMVHYIFSHIIIISMKKLLPIVLVLSVMTGIASAQTTTPTVPPAIEASAGLTPESSLYFLDKISESLQELFAFTPEAKVRLQLQFAAERVAEAKAMLADQGDHTKGLDAIKSGLTENVQKTADILKQEKAAGKDVSGLAKEANDQLDTEENDLNRSLAESQKETVDKKIEETKKLLEAARATKDEAKIQAAQQDLETNQQIAEDLKAKREEIRQSFHEEKKAVEDEMSADDQNEDQLTGENENSDASSSADINREGGAAGGTRLRDVEPVLNSGDQGDSHDNNTGDQGGDRADN